MKEKSLLPHQTAVRDVEVTGIVTIRHIIVFPEYVDTL